MKSYTKDKLIEKLKESQERERRLKRSLKQALIEHDTSLCIDFKSFDHELQTSDHVLDAMARAEYELSLNVTEPGLGGNSDRITIYIKSVDALGWTWENDYKKNGQFSWCGAFAAMCFTKVQFKIRQKIFPSCYRLYTNFNNTSRRVSDVRPGDIVTVFTSKDKTPNYGNHIVLPMSLPNADGDFDTIEGNAKGYGPDGEWREGVSKRTRNIKDVACIYRLQEDDFDE